MTMNGCTESQDLWMKELYEGLNAEESIRLDRHLSECVTCSRELVELKKTADTMSQRRRPEPSEEYWNQYWDKLSTKLQKEPPAPVIPFYRKRVTIQMYRVAAAILLVLLGVIIGRHYVPSTPPLIVKETPDGTVSVQQANLDVRTNRFLERSQVLILGLIHTQETDNSNLAVPLKVSHELVQEASTLKSELEKHKRKQLKRLVSDLEFILLQISNLESEHDFSDIELLRSGVDQKGILLKINMEQMRLGTFEDSKKTPVQGKSDL